MSRKSFIQGTGTGAFFLCLIAAPLYYTSHQKIQWLLKDLVQQQDTAAELQQHLVAVQKEYSDCDYELAKRSEELSGEQARVAFRDQQIEIWKNEHAKMEQARAQEITAHTETFNQWKQAEAHWIEERVRLETLPPAEKQILQARLAQAESALRKARQDFAGSARKAIWLAISSESPVAAIRPIESEGIRQGLRFILCDQKETLADGEFLRPHNDGWLVAIKSSNKSLSTLVKGTVLHIFDHNTP